MTAYVKAVTPWIGTSPIASGSFTPTNANDALIVYSVNGSGSGLANTVSGTGTYNALQANLNDPTNANTLAIYANGSCSGAAQTITLTGAASNTLAAWAYEYSGAAAIYGSQLLRNAPGTGAGAILGTSVNVPMGAVLVALCADISGGTDTISSPSGTNRGSGTPFGVEYCTTEYAGAGAAIQPSFTSTVGGGTHEFWVAQILLIGPAEGRRFRKGRTAVFFPR